MSSKFKRILFFFTLTACLAPVFAQDSSISIDSNVDKSTIRIGDVVKYSIVVTRSPDIRVEMPGLAANLDSFEIRNYETYQPESVDGKVVERLEYDISTFEVGEFAIPPLIFRYTLPGDSTKHILKTKKLTIVVESLLDSEAGDIRDIKFVLEILRDYREIIVWSSVGFAFVILIGVLIYLWRRKKAGKGLLPQKIEPPLPAHVIAFDELTALKQSTLLEDGQVKEYYIQVSDIIRRYIEGRYFIVALELTTHELIELLVDAENQTDIVKLVQDFLESCDLVKFAKYQPTEKENATIIEQAFEVVEKSKLIYDFPKPELQSDNVIEMDNLEETKELNFEKAEEIKE